MLHPPNLPNGRAKGLTGVPCRVYPTTDLGSCMRTSAEMGAAAGRFLNAAPEHTPLTILPTWARDSYLHTRRRQQQRRHMKQTQARQRWQGVSNGWGSREQARRTGF